MEMIEIPSHPWDEGHPGLESSRPNRLTQVLFQGFIAAASSMPGNSPESPVISRHKAANAHTK